MLCFSSTLRCVDAEQKKLLPRRHKYFIFPPLLEASAAPHELKFDAVVGRMKTVILRREKLPFRFESFSTFLTPITQKKHELKRESFRHLLCQLHIILWSPAKMKKRVESYRKFITPHTASKQHFSLIHHLFSFFFSYLFYSVKNALITRLSTASVSTSFSCTSPMVIKRSTEAINVGKRLGFTICMSARSARQ